VTANGRHHARQLSNGPGVARRAELYLAVLASGLPDLDMMRPS
jgi:hypothetical protein